MGSVIEVLVVQLEATLMQQVDSWRDLALTVEPHRAQNKASCTWSSTAVCEPGVWVTIQPAIDCHSVAVPD
jgi:hypothetical protein